VIKKDGNRCFLDINVLKRWQVFTNWTVSVLSDIRLSFNEQLHATGSRAVASHQCVHLAEGKNAEGG
jgi:hypothetical protein